MIFLLQTRINGQLTQPLEINNTTIINTLKHVQIKNNENNRLFKNDMVIMAHGKDALGCSSSNSSQRMFMAIRCSIYTNVHFL